MTDFDAFLRDANAEFDRVEVKASTTEQTFPCPTCLGTGKYQGARVHQEKSHCFACRGLGYFKTDPRKLAKNREAARQRKAAKAEAAREVNSSHDEGKIIKWLSANIEWNQFASSMIDAHNEGKQWSDKQVAAARSMIVKTEERRAQRAAERQQAAVSVDLAPIRTIFETAVQSGYKRPTYRAEGLVISRAPDTGRNPGALYVKGEGDAYLGKIIGTEFQPSREGREAKAADALKLIAEDPLAAAVRWGQRTGRCSCCGRELTNHASIDAGIGPVCASKWGL